jgi:hypothetical protein
MMAVAIPLHEQDVETGRANSLLRVSFDVVVANPQAQWHAAAQIAFQQLGISIAEVEDVIGPAEDPMVIECLTMLTAPIAIAGCVVVDFSVEQLASPKSLSVYAARVCHQQRLKVAE